MEKQSTHNEHTAGMSKPQLSVPDRVFVPLNDDLEHHYGHMRGDAVSALGDLVPFQIDVAPVMTFNDGLFTLTYLPQAS